MTLFDNGRLRTDVTAWIVPTLTALSMLGGLAVVYASFSSQNAVQDERITALKVRVEALSTDHDIMTRLEVRLANIERILTERSRAP